MPPLINWPRCSQKKIQMYVPLPYTFNVKNSIHLIEDLCNIPFNPNLQFVSFDITNMYSNVPTGDLLRIIDLICDQLKHELINLSKAILEQNYIHFENNFYSQDSGLAMGFPMSSVFSEIDLQYMENTAIFDILVHNNITGYFRYVDDILVVYDKNITDVNEVFDSFNKLMPTMKFTIEKEIENKKNTYNIYNISTILNGILLQMEFLRDPYLGPCLFSYMLMTYHM